MFQVLEHFHKEYGFTTVIHGGAEGADKLGGTWAELKRIPVEEYKAKWHLYGRAAGPMRNRQMLEEGKPDLVIAFPGHKGTANLVMQANEASVEIKDCRDLT